MSDFPVGTVVDGRYRIVSRLGSGGMADVYCADDSQLGRQVALKLLHRRFAEDPAFVERFRREAQSAAGLQHPNVVSIYDRGEYEGTRYIAMEYLPGRTLKQVIRDEAPIDPVRAIDLTLQILKAARFAHRHGIVHRDLKPHNVMVDDGGHVKVTDFGIARAGASDMTETGSIMGTAQYLSPEQAQGMAVTESSDLYSVAVVLYELLTGRVPFDAESAVTIALRHVSEAPTPPTRLNPAVPPALEQVVMWALNKEPADRPADADALIAALNHARETIRATEPGQATAEVQSLAGLAAVGEAGPRPRIPPVIPAEAAAVVAAGAVAVGPAEHPLTGAHAPVTGTGELLPPPIGDDRPRRASRWPWYALLVALLVAGAGVTAYLLTRGSTAVVPAVAGQTVSTAQTLVQNAGFTPNLQYRTSIHPKDFVFGQSPDGGTRADRGSTVTLTVSSGPGQVSVPSVKDLKLKAAQAQIRRAGLKVGRILSKTSATVPAGSVIDTDPASGIQVQVGGPVTIFVSSGPAPVNVPNVVGLPRAEAQSRLLGLAVTPKFITQTSGTDPAGNVIAQSATGTVAPGTTITLTVAAAPPSAGVPDVTGQSAAAARSQLAAAGFKVSIRSQTVTDPTQDGQVISQTPAANATAAKGSTVKLVVGKLSTPTTPTDTTTTPTTPTTATTTTPR